MRQALAGALALALICTGVTAMASRRNSTTFDEIVLMAGGARGWVTGEWNIAPEHPPLMQYLYGLPIHLTHPQLPDVKATPDSSTVRDFSFRYVYSRAFFWASGNDPEKLAFLGRMMGAIMAGLLVLAVFGLAQRFGPLTALSAAALTAFLPDVLAHGGVAYNDLPLALGYVLGVWALDAAVRRPSPLRGAVAGLALAFALAVKFSAVLLAPVALLLIVLGAVAQPRAEHWWRDLSLAALAALAAMYLALVLVYRGDFTLAEMMYGLRYTFGHVERGHGAPSYLLGNLSVRGWWYFFPVAFLLKTPAALQLLLLMALLGFARTWQKTSWRALAGAGLRAPLMGLGVFAFVLLTSNLDIGFRYALPALPLLAIVVAAGVTRLFAASAASPPLRYGLAGLLLWYAGSTLSYYPDFLAYTSEYGHSRQRGDLLLLDSSLDWGQGLLELRDFMRARHIERVYLSYFGSAMPDGYGIRYVALPSFYPLPRGPRPVELPEYAVISATNLHSVYLPGDPLKMFRTREPDAVIAHSMLVYRVGNAPGN